MEFFTTSIEKFSLHLITNICNDYNLDLDELKARYIGAKMVKTKVAKIPMEDRPACKGLSGKKKIPCKNRCRPGSDACHLHGQCQPCKVPQVPQVPPEVTEQIKVAIAAHPPPPPPPAAVVQKKQPKKIKEAEPKQAKKPPPIVVAPPPPPPPPPPQNDMSLDDRLKQILQGGGADFDSDEDEDEDDEPDSPGEIRHKEILKAKGKTWADYEDEDEDEEGFEEEEEELED
jgi:hypothetical protein